MKTHKILVSQNAWEYSGRVLIKANDVKFKFTDPYRQEHKREDEDGDTLMADGVEIIFDEAFEYHGIVK